MILRLFDLANCRGRHFFSHRDTACYLGGSNSSECNDMFEEISESHSSKLAANARLIRKYSFVRTFLQLARSNRNFRNAVSTAKTKRRALRQVGLEFHHSHYPEETFEAWHEHPHINANLTRHKVAKPHADPKRLADTLLAKLNNKGNDAYDKQIDSEAHDRSNYNEYHDTLLARRILEDSSLSMTKFDLVPQTCGFELPPQPAPEKRIVEHMNTLRDVVYLKILDRDFDAAFRAYSLLIRLPVDIRSLWPIGIEILRQQHRSNPSKYSILRDDRFFDWLEAFYPVPKTKEVLVYGTPRVIRAPAWRSGTQLQVPLFAITSLWSLIAKGKYARVREKLDEYLLSPPYNMCGELYFIRVLCHLMELCDMARDARVNSASSAKQYADIKRFNLIRTSIKTCCISCDHFHFEYDKDWLDESIDFLKDIVCKEVMQSEDISLSEESENDVAVSRVLALESDDNQESERESKSPRTEEQINTGIDSSDDDSYFTADEKLQVVETSQSNPDMEFDFDLG